MPHTTAPSPRTRVRRLPERAHHDAATVAAIVDAAMICTVAFQIDGMVHAIPRSTGARAIISTSTAPTTHAWRKR